MSADPRTVYEVELLAASDVAPNTRLLSFERPSSFDYAPGQFLSFLLPVNGEIVRPYTIASPPEQPGPLEIVLDLVPGGVGSHYLFSLRPGARLRFTGPWGSFVLRHALEAACIFVALGTGIAAIRPMLHRAWSTTQGHLLRLHHFVPDLAHQLYRDEFVRAVRTQRNFEYEALFSVDAVRYIEGRYVDGERDPSARFFVCGVGPDVYRIRDLLRQAGYDRRAVQYEKW